MCSLALSKTTLELADVHTLVSSKDRCNCRQSMIMGDSQTSLLMSSVLESRAAPSPQFPGGIITPDRIARSRNEVKSRCRLVLQLCVCVQVDCRSTSGIVRRRSTPTVLNVVWHQLRRKEQQGSGRVPSIPCHCQACSDANARHTMPKWLSPFDSWWTQALGRCYRSRRFLFAPCEQ